VKVEKMPYIYMSSFLEQGRLVGKVS